jgi:hypothetical protein
VQLRHDHGSVYMSDDFQNEIRFVGMESSPSYVRQPEGRAARGPDGVPRPLQPPLDHGAAEVSHARPGEALSLC